MGSNLKNDDAFSKEHEKVLLSKRWILSYIGMLGFCVLYSLRVNISVAIICMVRNTNDTDTHNDTDSTCGAIKKTEKEDTGEFDWDKSTQSVILSSFFYGYIFTQIIGGWVAGKFGGKFVLGSCLGITSLATVLLPVSARWDYRMVVALRVIMGIFEGVAYPTMHSMWGRWAPPQERTRLTSFCYTGSNIGNIVTFIVAGFLCAEGFDNGWGSVFYVTGGAGLLWTASWFYLVSNSPDTHPTITPAEKDYILHSIGNTSPKASSIISRLHSSPSYDNGNGSKVPRKDHWAEARERFVPKWAGASTWGFQRMS